MSKQWESKCNKVAEELGINVSFYDDEPERGEDIFEDDGTLHIRRKDGRRACFSVAVGDSAYNQNSNTREVIKRMGIVKAQWDRVLLDEDDEDDDDSELCPHCGQPMRGE